MSPTFERELPGVKAVSEEIVPIRRIDPLTPEFPTQQDRVWVKLDVEGYELHALRGASEALQRASVLDIELATASLYEGEPRFFEVAEESIDWDSRFSVSQRPIRAPTGAPSDSMRCLGGDL